MAEVWNPVDGWHAWDDHGILHSRCLETVTDEFGGTMYLPWECGNIGFPRNSELFNSGIDCSVNTVACPSPSMPSLLGFCNYGVLVSCVQDSDCHTGAGIAASDFSASLGSNKLAPHYMTEAQMDQHLYCSAGHCAIDDHRSCCHIQYGGQQPFETIEARSIRELINNVPFTAVIDMHSSRSDLKFRCPNVGYGCSSSNDFFANGQGLEAAMIDAYNAAADQHWGSLYGGDDLLDFLLLVDKDESVRGEGHGYLAGWTAGKPEHDPDKYPYSAPGNFDNGTIKALPSFTWELGTLRGFEDNTVWESVVGCNDTSNLHPGQPRSRLMVENQLAGARELVFYMAEESLTPGVGLDNTGWAIAPLPRRDIAVSGLRIHDGHGRGIQQTETGGYGVTSLPELSSTLDADKEARIVVPAGIWAVSADVHAGWSGGFYAPLDADVTVSLKKLASGPVISGGAWVHEDADLFSETMPPETMERFTTRFKLEAGERYMIEAKVNNPIGIANDNDTKANDSQIIKVEVLDCNDTSELPNGLDEEEFCEKGIPFDDNSFECSDIFTTLAGRCRECWSSYPQQDCGPGEFCYEGMCDDPETCWSGGFEDQYEGASGSETWPSFYYVNSFTTETRTLHLKPGPTGAPVQDIDSVLVNASLSGYVVNLAYLNFRVINLCNYGEMVFGFPGPSGPMEELKVRVQKKVFTGWGVVFVDLTDPSGDGWVEIDKSVGLELQLQPDEIVALMAGTLQLKIDVKNNDVDPESFPYKMEISLDHNGFYSILNEAEQWALIPVWVPIMDRMKTVQATIDPGEDMSVIPSLSGLNAGGMVFFMPDLGFEPTAYSGEIEIKDLSGEVPLGGDQLPIVSSPVNGGLGLPMDELIADNGPFTVTLRNERERMEGSLYMCPTGTNDCSQYEPERDICPNCGADGNMCCIGEDGTYTCRDLLGDDDLNCGACGIACEWDEFCLDGVCASGQGTSCWNTTCTGGTVCVSDNWFWQTDPSCKAILVDPDYCGWFGDTCEYNESCTLGFCAAKMRQTCDLQCGLGESCCWVLGVETCIDTDNGLFNCGGCGNVCPVGTLCEDGLCEWWYDVYNPCPSYALNCGWGGSVDCTGILDDDDNCGGCGVKCSDTGACIGGGCIDQSTADAAESGEME